jgi:hypothetical protein
MGRDRAGTNGERGQGLVLAALVMAVLLGVVALALDVGLLLHERRTAQNAADAMSLAGALELPDDPAAAVLKAQEWAAKNGVPADEIQTIEVRTTFVANDTLHVEVSRDFSWVFGRVMGMVSSEVGADASAIKGSPVGLGGLRPFAVTDEMFQPLASGDTSVLKFDAGDSQSGNFLPIRLDGQGASVYEETIMYGSNAWVCIAGQERPGCPSIVITETGNVVGPTEAALEWVDLNTPAACDTFDEVFTPIAGSDMFAMAASCNPWTTSQPATKVAIVPVIDKLCNGSCDVTILDFAMFFFEGVQCDGKGKGSSCQVMGTYVKTPTHPSAYVGPLDPDGVVTFVRLIE